MGSCPDSLSVISAVLTEAIASQKRLRRGHSGISHLKQRDSKPLEEVPCLVAPTNPDIAPWLKAKRKSPVDISIPSLRKIRFPEALKSFLFHLSVQDWAV